MKEIIDVTKCNFNTFDGGASQRTKCTLDNCFCDGIRNKDCYYKQLKRLEQENAELKAKIKKFQDMAKKGLDEFKDVGGCWGCGLQLQLNQDMEDIKQLKAENERLKSENETYDREQYYYYNLSEDYKQTLQEIKKIAKSEYYAVEPDARYITDKILDLITKAEVGE